MVLSMIPVDEFRRKCEGRFLGPPRFRDRVGVSSGLSLHLRQPLTAVLATDVSGTALLVQEDFQVG